MFYPSRPWQHKEREGDFRISFCGETYSPLKRRLFSFHCRRQMTHKACEGRPIMTILSRIMHLASMPLSVVDQSDQFDSSKFKSFLIEKTALVLLPTCLAVHEELDNCVGESLFPALSKTRSTSVRIASLLHSLRKAG